MEESEPSPQSRLAQPPAGFLSIPIPAAENHSTKRFYVNPNLLLVAFPSSLGYKERLAAVVILSTSLIPKKAYIEHLSMKVLHRLPTN